MQIQIKTAKLLRTLRGTPAELKQAMRAAGQRAGQRFLAFHRQERLSGQKGVVGLKATRKGLISHFRAETEGDNLRMFTRSRVALEFEEGRTLFPRNSKFLAVPMKPALDANGKVKKVARRLLKENRDLVQAAEFGLTFKQRKSKRTLILFTARSGKKILGVPEGGKIIPYFHLETKVKMKPRLEFVKTWRIFIPKAVQIFRAGIPFALRAAQKKAAGGAP